MHNPDHQRQFGGSFPTTNWSLVSDAAAIGSDQSREALEQLCRIYWQPLYDYVRHRGNDAEAARDLTQSFLARICSSPFLMQVDRAKGSFRGFLLGALKHFLADDWDRRSALKRGGGERLLSLDEELSGGGRRGEPSDDRTPDRIFERRWAMVLLQQSAARLRQEYERAGKGVLYEQLIAFLAGDHDDRSYAEVAGGLGMPASTLKSHVHRLRRRNREILRRVVAQTLMDSRDVDEEIRYLLGVLSE